MNLLTSLTAVIGGIVGFYSLKTALAALPFALAVAAASLLYHGIFAVLKLENEIDAQALSYAAFSVGILVWVVLCTFVIVPLMN